MNSISAVLLVMILSLVTGCSHYSDISGKVIDGATGNPIEGAVVVAEWMQFHGWLGEQQRELYKMIETNTDKEGKFSISGTTGMFLDPPVMIIYKEGYLPWRNDSIFPSRNTVKNHEWKNNVTYKLDNYTSRTEFKLTYVYNDSFSLSHIESFIESGLMGYDDKAMPILRSKMDKLSSERRMRDDTLISLTFNGIIVDQDTGEPIEGALLVAFNQGDSNLPNVTQTVECLSDEAGKVRITGNFTLLERPPPRVVVYKKGYIALTSGPQVGNLGNELYGFKWENGYQFKLSKWNPRITHKEQFDYITKQFPKNSKLLDLIKWERDEK